MSSRGYNVRARRAAEVDAKNLLVGGERRYHIPTAISQGDKPLNKRQEDEEEENNRIENYQIKKNYNKISQYKAVQNAINTMITACLYDGTSTPSQYLNNFVFTDEIMKIINQEFTVDPEKNKRLFKKILSYKYNAEVDRIRNQNNVRRREIEKQQEEIVTKARKDAAQRLDKKTKEWVEERIRHFEEEEKRKQNQTGPGSDNFHL